MRHLRYFAAVADHLSFTRAARTLRIAQPSLSVQVRNLEAEVGAQLLLREGRSIRLTDAGQAFLERAKAILRDASESIETARRAEKGEVGNLSIGYNTTVEFSIFPFALPAFRACVPDVHLSLESLTLPRQRQALRRGDLDIGFSWTDETTREFDSYPLTKESLVAVVPTAHQLARIKGVSVRDLAAEPLVMFRRELAPEPYHQLEILFAKAGVSMRVAYEVGTLLSMINFVAMGLGCCLAPDHVRKIRREGVSYKPLLRPNLVRRLSIVKLKGRGGIAQRFFDIVVDTFDASDLN